MNDTIDNGYKRVKAVRHEIRALIYEMECLTNVLSNQNRKYNARFKEYEMCDILIKRCLDEATELEITLQRNKP